MENKIIEEALKNAHNLLDAIECVQNENKLLRAELTVAEARLKVLQRAMENQTANTDEQEQWHIIGEDGEMPYENELVIVDTESRKPFMQTYVGSFTSGVVAWLRIQERA